MMEILRAIRNKLIARRIFHADNLYLFSSSKKTSTPKVEDELRPLSQGCLLTVYIPIGIIEDNILDF